MDMIITDNKQKITFTETLPLPKTTVPAIIVNYKGKDRLMVTDAGVDVKKLTIPGLIRSGELAVVEHDSLIGQFDHLRLYVHFVPTKPGVGLWGFWVTSSDMTYPEYDLKKIKALGSAVLTPGIKKQITHLVGRLLLEQNG